MDGTSDIDNDITWLSYRELGKARGISTASARRLALRHRWRKQQANDGTVRVAVPMSGTSPHSDDGSEASSDAPADTNALAAIAASLQTTLVELQAVLATQAQRRAVAEAARDDNDADNPADLYEDFRAVVRALTTLLAEQADRVAAEIEHRMAAEAKIAVLQAKASAQQEQEKELARQLVRLQGRSLWARIRNQTA